MLLAIFLELSNKTVPFCMAKKDTVNSLMQGQKNYIDERIEKRRTMTVSNGYAWTRPNHIDDAIAKADFLDYQLKFAG